MAVSDVQSAPLAIIQAAETHEEVPSASSGASSSNDKLIPQERDPGEVPSNPEGQLEASKVSSSSALNVRQLKGRKHKKKVMIKTLEKKLKVLERHIRKCNEAELSIDEMNSGTSAYMKEDLYKRKFVATWQELCKLSHVSDEIEVAERDGSGVYTGTPYPEINRRVQRLLKLDEFPDHFDILELVERCNSKYDLGIGAEEKSQLSRKIFKEVGKLLQERRQRDFTSHFGSYLTDSIKFDEDPALIDVVLLQQLKDSLQEGKDKMEQVCEDFVTKQEQEQDSSKSPEGDSCNSDIDQDDDDEDGEAGEEMQAFSPEADLGDEISDHSLEDEDHLDQICEDNELDATGNGSTSGKDELDSVPSKQVEKNERDIDKDSCPPAAKKPKLYVTSEETIHFSSITAGPCSSLPDQTETPPVKSTPSQAQVTTLTQSAHEVICLSDGSDSDSDVICIDSQ